MNNEKTCQVFHADLWGLREKKYKCLMEYDIKTTEWRILSPKSEFYLFIPRDEKLLGRYEKNVKITDIFPVHSVGIVTSRDNFVVDNNKKELVNRIQMFKNSTYSDEDLHEYFKINKKKGWNIRKAWNVVKSLSDSEINNCIQHILYRPFDTRWIFFHDELIERTRKSVMRHMMQDNLGICIGRAGQVVGLKKPWNIVFCSEYIEDFNLFYRGGNVNFPLYIYPETNKKDLFTPTDPQEKQPNINPVIFKFLTDSYNKKPTPENIFYYIYAVLYSNIYRTKYAEFLKIDFPRVPLTKDYGIFNEMGAIGKRLIGLHLMKSPELDTPIAKFPVDGENKVEKPIYDSEVKQVYINKNQYFKGVPPDVWEYQIGGYQVCRKWLKDRKGRKLSLDDIKHYCLIVTAVNKTIELQNEIDERYPDVEKNIIEFDDTGL